MAMIRLGWLFGLEGSLEQPLALAGLTIRRMTDTERQFICARAVDFFAQDTTIWNNTTARFPFLYATSVPPDSPLPGWEDMVAVLLSVLASGEVRTPIQWAERDGSMAGGSSCSEVLALFERLINSRYQTVRIEAVVEAFQIAIDRLGDRMRAPAAHTLGAVLLERFIESKHHPISLSLESHNVQNVIARATDTAVMLEYIFQEGGTTEVGFKLAMSVAWLLGNNADERGDILKVLGITYALRSKRIHGADISPKPLKRTEVDAVVTADKLLRRVLLSKVLANLDDKAWKQLFKSARLGELPQTFDKVTWMPR
jgi:hypothetical protein